MEPLLPLTRRVPAGGESRIVSPGSSPNNGAPPCPPPSPLPLRHAVSRSAQATGVWVGADLGATTRLFPTPPSSPTDPGTQVLRAAFGGHVCFARCALAGGRLAQGLSVRSGAYLDTIARLFPTPPPPSSTLASRSCAPHSTGAPSWEVGWLKEGARVSE